MRNPGALFESGQTGPLLGVFDGPGANARLYKSIPMLPLNICRAIAFSPLGQNSFSPDALLLTLLPSEAEIVLRAPTVS